MAATPFTLGSDGLIHGAKLTDLMDYLVDSSCSENELRKHFALTFHSFTTVADVIEYLIAKSAPPPRRPPADASATSFPPPDVRLLTNVVELIELIVDCNFYPLKCQPNLVDKLLSHLDSIKHLNGEDLEDLIGTICHKIIMNEDGVEESALVAQLAPISMASLSSKKKKLPATIASLEALFSLDPALLAQQFTHTDSCAFTAIEPRECLNTVFRESPHEAPNFNALKASFNRMTNMASALICGAKKQGDRVTAVKALVAVAQECEKLNNFNTMLAITGAFQRALISRLSSQWTKKVQTDTLLQGYLPLLAPKAFAERVTQVSPPLVPYVAYFEDMLVRIDVNNECFLSKEDGVVNVSKARMSAACLARLQSLQPSAVYYIDPIVEVQAFLEEWKTLSDDDLWELSYKVIPNAVK